MIAFAIPPSVTPLNRHEQAEQERAFNQAFLGFKLDLKARDSQEAVLIRVCSHCAGATAVRAWARASSTRVTDGICSAHYAEMMAKIKVL